MYLLNKLFFSELPYPSWVSPEAIIGGVFLLLPGFCICLLPVLMIVLGFRFSSQGNSRFLKSILLFLIPIPIFSLLVNFLTHLEKPKCLLCFFSNKVNCLLCFFCNKVRLSACPLHDDLIWFVGSTLKRTKLYFKSTGLYFGSVFGYCLNMFILMQTASPESLSWGTWISMAVTTSGLALIPYEWYSFCDDEKEGFLSKGVSSLAFLIIRCRKQENSVATLYIGPTSDNDSQLQSCPLPTNPKPAFVQKPKKMSCKEKVHSWISSQSIKTPLLLALFLLNGICNVATLVVIITFCVRTGTETISICLPSIYFSMLFNAFLSCVQEAKIDRFR